MAGIVGLEIKGLDNVFNNINKVIAECVDLSKIGLEKVGDDILRDSQIECPVSNKPTKGTLKRTGKKYTTSFSGFHVCEIKYGGPEAPYALYVHEDLEAQHVPPTKAKFLEDPYNRHLSTFVAKIARELGPAFTK